MTRVQPQTTDEVRTNLEELSRALLPLSTWQMLDGHLDHLSRAVAADDETAVRSALVPVSRAVFEAKVRNRLNPSRAGAGIVIPTKKTPALPLVGAVCGGVLLLLGWLLGGAIVFAATAVLGLLVVAVALAGTRSNAEHAAARQARTAEPDDRVGAPGDTSGRLAEIRAQLQLS
jgi:hypothetical protein